MHVRKLEDKITKDGVPPDTTEVTLTVTGTVTAIVNVTKESFFVQGHFP